MNGTIRVITGEREFKFKEKGSLFIGSAKPVDNEDDAVQYLNESKKKYYDATHHCYCYKINPSIVKYSDAGEPNGTAGIRILNAINHLEVTNLIVVVTRYFGGIKLGVGPLGKAYYYTALETLKSTVLEEKKIYQAAVVEFEFEQTKTIHHILNKHQAIVEKTDYNTKPSISFLVLPGNLEPLKKDMTSLLTKNFLLTVLDRIKYR